MQKLITVCLLTLAFAVTSAARADEESHRLEGTFCSVAAVDGTWAVYFGPADIDANCRIARDGLASSTRAPIDAENGGYYLPQGWNEAVVQCGLIRSYFYDRGALALQRAFNYAQIINGQHCIFEVYYQD